MPVNNDDVRRSGTTKGAGEYRSEAERDRDRILYSEPFRRLAGVTQVAAVSERMLLHNRLTHSLKVAHVGRRLVQSLRHRQEPLANKLHLNEDTVEAAGLAHDLGHPPFGHVAEKQLHELTKNFGGFEGNAQTLRVVTKLAVHQGVQGLDLTSATLDGIMKYPQLEAIDKAKRNFLDRSIGDKWGVYATEAVYLDFIRPESRGGHSHEGEITLRSISAILMDWADDISYAIHDIEDYVRSALIPAQIMTDDNTFQSYLIEKLTRAYHESKSFSGTVMAKKIKDDLRVPFSEPFSGSRSDTSALEDFTSSLLSIFINAVSLTDYEPFVEIDDGAIYLVEALKNLTWFYVIDQPALAAVQQGHKRLISDLYVGLNQWLDDEGVTSPRLAQRLREYLAIAANDRFPDGGKVSGPHARARGVSDYICSLTEIQALDLHARLTGSSDASIFGSWY